MKEAIIAFLLALVIGSYLNSRQVDSGNGGDGSVPSIPISDDPPAPSDFSGRGKQIDPDMDPRLNPSSRTQSVQAVTGMPIPKIDEPGFDRDVIKSATPVLVFFTAAGSDSCQREMLTVQQVAAKTQANLRVVQVDVMAYPALGQQWGAVSVPTFALFKDGQKVDLASGELDAASLLSLVKRSVPDADKG